MFLYRTLSLRIVAVLTVAVLTPLAFSSCCLNLQSCEWTTSTASKQRDSDSDQTDEQCSWHQTERVIANRVTTVCVCQRTERLTLNGLPEVTCVAASASQWPSSDIGQITRVALVLVTPPYHRELSRYTFRMDGI